MKRSFFIALAAAVLSAKMAGAVGYTGEEIDRLDDMVESQNLHSIREFVRSKPDISPSDPLGSLLLSLVDDSAGQAEGVDVTWNVHRYDRRKFRNRARGNGLAWHWRPSHRVLRGLYGKPGKQPPHIY